MHASKSIITNRTRFLFTLFNLKIQIVNYTFLTR